MESHITTSLSSDSLGQIVKYLGGEALCQLFCCGCLRLNQLLASHGCVIHFRIKRHLNRVISRSIWPIVHFKALQSLTIRLDGGDSTIRFLCTKTLYQLPPSLQKIELCANDSEECWLRDAPRQGSRGYRPNDSQPPFDFSRAFPALHSLHLMSNQLEVAPNSASSWAQHAKLRESDIALLPISMTSLKLPANGNLSVSGLLSLPPALEVLYLRSFTGDDASWQSHLSRLPLRKLRFDSVESSLELSRNWPKTLHDFRVGQARWKPHFLEAFPDSLQTLHVGMVPSSSKSQLCLPKQLLSLKLATFCTADDVSNFSRSLTSLDLWHCPPGSLPLSHLPPGLIHLKLPRFGSKYAKEAMSDLPDCLRSLAVKSLSKDAFTELPSHLEVLSLQQFSKRAVVMVKQLNLPGTLWRLGKPDCELFRLPSASNNVFTTHEEAFNLLRKIPKLTGGWKTMSEIFSTSDLPLWSFTRSQGIMECDQPQKSISMDRPDILRQWMLFSDTSDCLVPYFSGAQGWPDQDRIEGQLLAWMAVAATHNAVQVMKMLHLEFGAPLSHHTQTRGELLRTAVSNESLAVLDWLVEVGYDILVEDEASSWNIFHFAGSKSSLVLLNWLHNSWPAIVKHMPAIHLTETLTWSSAINSRSKHGLTPLHLAATNSIIESEDFTILDWLVKHEADLDAATDDGVTIGAIALLPDYEKLLSWLQSQHRDRKSVV